MDPLNKENTLVLISVGAANQATPDSIRRLCAPASSEVWAPEHAVENLRRELGSEWKLVSYPETGLVMGTIPPVFRRCVLFLLPPFGQRCRRLYCAALRSGSTRFFVCRTHTPCFKEMRRVRLLFAMLLAELGGLMLPLFAGAMYAALLALARLKRRPAAGGRITRLAFFVGGLDLGGAERQLLALCLGLLRKGYEVHVVRMDPIARALVPRFEEAGARCWDLGAYEQLTTCERFLVRLFDRYPRYRNIGAVVRLAALLRNERVDLVQSMLDSANFVAGPAGRLAGAALVVGGLRNTYCTEDPEYPWGGFQKTYRRIAWTFDGWISNSRSGAATFASWTGIPAHIIRTVPNGIGEEVFPAPRSSEQGKTAAGPTAPAKILFVGRLVWQKRPQDFVEVCHRLQQRGILFTARMAGDGHLRASLQTQIHDKGLDSLLTLVGKQSELCELYEWAHVLVATSAYEGFPNSIMEAHWFGLPVVTTDAGEAAAIVASGETGFVAPVGDIEALAERVSRLVSDLEEARRMGRLGQCRVRSLFSLSQLTERTIESYTSMIVSGEASR